MEERSEKEVAQDVGHNFPEEDKDDAQRKRSRSRDDVHRRPQEEVEEKPNNVEGTHELKKDKVEEDECKKEQTHHNDKDDVKKDNEKKEADDEDVSDSCEENSTESEDPVVPQAFETWTWHQPMGDVTEDMEWTAEDDDAWDADTDRDYYAALELAKSSNISSSRVRAAYHRLAHRWHPYHGSWRWEGDTAADAPADAARRVALRRFWTIAEAYLVLADPERRRIYDECGFKGLKQSEACYAEPIFEKDAFQLYEDFFNGTDPEAREFLLMNGGAASSDSEDSDGAEMEQLNLEAPGADGAEKKSLAMPVLPPDIAKAVGVEKVSAGLDEQFREMLNSALSAAPSAAGEMDPEDAGLEANVETLDDKIQAAPSEGLEGLSSTTPCVSQKKVFWKYWKGLRFGLRCPKPGT